MNKILICEMSDLSSSTVALSSKKSPSLKTRFSFGKDISVNVGGVTSSVKGIHHSEHLNLH